jgi:plastocyanin
VIGMAAVRLSAVSVALLAMALAQAPVSAAERSASIAQKRVSVSVRDNAFSPKTATVARGGTVTWRWAGRRSHNVVGPDFKSRLMRTGTFSKRFTRTGSFKYVCTVHSGMTGTVRVR